MAVEFNGLLDEFEELDAQVVGVTSDKPETHRKWAARNRVQIPMIDDVGREVARAFAVAQRTGGTMHVTFLLDEDGTIRHVYPKVKSKGHASIVLRDCMRIWG